MLPLIVSIISIFVVVGVSTTMYVQAAKQQDLYNKRLSEVVGKTNSANQYEFEKNKEQEVSIDRVRGDIIKFDGQISGINKNIDNVMAEYGGKIADMSSRVTNVNQHVTKTLGNIQTLTQKHSDSLAQFNDALGKTTGEVSVLSNQMAIVNGKLVNIGEKQQTAIDGLLEDTRLMQSEQGSLRDYVYNLESKTSSDIKSQNNTISGLQSSTTSRLLKQDEEITKAFNIAKSVQNIVMTLNTAIDNVRMKFNDYVSKTDILNYATKTDLSGVNANFGNYVSNTDFNDYKSTLPTWPTTQEMNVLVQSFVTDTDIQSLITTLGDIQLKINDVTALTNSLGETYATKQDLLKLSGDVGQETINIAGLYSTLTSLQSGLQNTNSLIMDVKTALDQYKLQVPQNYASKTYVDDKLTALETSLGSLLSTTKTMTLDGLTINSTLQGTGDIKLNNIALSKGYTSYPEGGTDRAEISNDSTTHKKLLLVGNRSGATGKREVGVWDNLTVSGNTTAAGKVMGADVQATGTMMVGADGSKGWFKSDGTGYVSGDFGVGVVPTDGMFGEGKKQMVVKGSKPSDWQVLFHNTNGGRNVYLNHGNGSGMHINANNNLATTYALQTHNTTGPTFEVMNDGKTNVYGDAKVTGKIRANVADTAKYPTGWGGGVMSYDIYANATVAAGDAAGNPKAWMNSSGDIVATRNLSVEGNTNISNKIQVTPNDPGPIIEKNYGQNDFRYGLGQWANGVLRTYAGASIGSVNMSIANPDGTFKDIVKATTGKTEINNTATVKGDMVFDGGNNWIIHTPDDNKRTMYIAPSKAYGNQDWNWPNEVKIDENGTMTAKQMRANVASTDKYPNGWGGGLISFDVYSAGGTIAAGDAAGNIKASINRDGDILAMNKICIGSVCINQTELENIKKGYSPSLITNSTILNASHDNAIKSLLGSFNQPILLYRASVDGFSSTTFHSKCDNKANIFVVMKSTAGYIATAFSTVAFNSSASYVSGQSGQAWLNNLQNPSGTISTTKFINSVYPQYTLYGNSGYGPTFGGGHDLHIAGDMKSGYTYPYSYNNNGYTNTSLFGSYNSWSLSEVEVYQISTLNSTILNSSHSSALQTLLPSNNLSLLYRASVDGFSSTTFHSKCDNKANIFVVMKSTAGYIATAFTQTAFNLNSNGSWISGTSGTAWLNNLQNPSGTISTTKFVNSNYPQYTLLGYSEYGPTFGGGHDLQISSGMKTGYTNPHSYNNNGYTNTSLFGSYNSWTLSEVEVFQVI